MMDWMNGYVNPQLVTRPENSLSFLYNCNYDYYPGIEMNYPMMETSVRGYPGMSDAEKKKRLTNEQLEYLENSFIEDQKLEPERKTKLAQELGLQLRQVAVWFQNRRARWKGKELERAYDALKCKFDIVFKEKKRLQEEVSALKMILREQANMNQQFSSGHTEISGEGTMESTPMENPSPTKCLPGQTNHDPHGQIVAQSMYGLNGDEYYPVTLMPSYWGTVRPSYS